MSKQSRSTYDLYKKDKKGKLRSWSQEAIEFESGDVIIMTTSGLVDGNLTERTKRIEDSTRENAYDRACKLIDNAVEKKTREGYWYSKEEALNAGVLVRPMLARPYNPDKVLPQRLYIQPKINGLRCLYDPETDKLYTKSGLEYYIPNIMEEVRNFSKLLGDNVVLDGELYIRGLPVWDILSAAKNLDNPDRYKFEYHIYDIVTDSPFEDRTQQIRQAFDKLGSNPVCKYVTTLFIYKHEELKGWYEQFLHEGWEGLMIRFIGVGYECDTRSSNLWKWKPIYDKEFKVVHVTYELRQHDGVQKHLVEFHCEHEGKMFKAIPKWSVDKRYQWYLDHRDKDPKVYIPRLDPLTCEYRELTNNGLPFHAVAIDFRPRGY